MASIITAKSNQSILDVIIQALGSLQAGMQFCADNGVSISDYPDAGTVYVVSDAALAQAGANGRSVLKYLGQNGIVVGTLSRPVEGVPLLNDNGAQLLNDDGSGLFS
jgi:hypothetical protein